MLKMPFLSIAVAKSLEDLEIAGKAFPKQYCNTSEGTVLVVGSHSEERREGFLPFLDGPWLGQLNGSHKVGKL